MPKFSIIVPIYKVEKYIKQCMQSILNQTYKDFEVICVDDCGKDNSMKIVEKMAQNDNRIIILHHDKNKGLSAARNTGFEIAKGEYTLFVDSDDWLETNCLEVLEYHFSQVDIESITFDAYRYDDNKHKRVDEAILKYTPGMFVISPPQLAIRCDYAWIKAYKTSAIRDKGLKFPEGLTFEDGEFFFKFFSFYPKTFVINDCLYNYREREGSIVTNAQKGKLKLEDIFQVIKNIRDFYIEENLYDTYKISLAILLRNRIGNCKNIPFQYNKAIRIVSDVLEYFGGVEEFREFEQDDNPLVSVLVTINNSDIDTIFNCLQSIQKQSYYNIEIICVLNNIDKNILSFLGKLCAEDKRIKVVECNNNDIYKQTIESSIGKYIVFLDSHDEIKQNYIKKAVNVLNENKTDFVAFKSNDKLCNIEEKRFLVDNASVCMLPMNIHNLVINRDFLVKNELIPQSSNYLQELCFKIYINSKYGLYINKNYYISKEKEVNVENICSEIRSIYDYLENKNIFDTYKQAFFKFAVNSINRVHNKNGTQTNSIIKECIDLVTKGEKI